MSEATHNLAHVTQALALFTEAFRNGPTNRAILSSWAQQIQEVEDALWNVLESRFLANAEDAQLDLIGKLVKESRLDRLDVDYRAAIRLRIRVLRSFGRANDLLDVAALAGGGVPTYRDEGIAAFVLDIFRVPAPRTVATFLRQVKPAGVLGHFVYSDNYYSSDVFSFTWGDAGGSYEGHAWGDSGTGDQDPVQPGLWAGVETL